MLSQDHVINAFRRFDNGERPTAQSKARRWFIQGDQSTLYPLKFIYALATKTPTMDFHTNDAKRELGALGFTIVEASTVEEVYENSDKAVKAAAIGDKAERDERLRASTGVAKEQFVVQRIFLRDPDVVAVVLERAKGVCETCEAPAPFLRAKDRSPYLEVHHRKPLALGGLDTVANAVAICPNCHRRAHFGSDAD